MRQLLHDWLTESDGKSFCPWNVMGMLAIGVMSYQFAHLEKPDPTAFAQFGLAVGAIITAISAKRYTEHSES